MRKQSRKSIVKKLDTVFSRIVRSESIKRYGLCPLCRAEQITQCFHFITSSKHSVRWDFRNAVGSCAGCNLRYEHDAPFVHQVVEYYRSVNGDDSWTKLVRDSNEVAHFSTADLLEILAGLEGISDEKKA